MANGNDDPSTFPVPPIPPVGSQSYPGGPAYDPTVPSPADWGSTPSPSVGVNWGGIAKALQGTDPAAGQQQSQSLPNLQVSGLNAGTQPASSGAVGAARAPSLDALVQMLMAKTNAYRAAANPRTALPVQALAQPRVAGLLGL